MKQSDASSIFTIWWRTRNALKRGKKLNLLWPALFGVVVLALDYKIGFSSRSMLQKCIEVFLSLDGGLLGFTIAGFGIFQSIPKSILNFSLSVKADGYPWSYYKLMLLNYVHVLFITFLGICFLIGLYIISFFPRDLFGLAYLPECRALFLALIFFVQSMVLVKLKVFIFWIYDNSLMLSQAAASKDHEKFPSDNPAPLIESNC